jgi:hypothetical protein
MVTSGRPGGFRCSREAQHSTRLAGTGRRAQRSSSFSLRSESVDHGTGAVLKKGAESPAGDPTAGDTQEAGRRPGPEGMPKSNDGDQRSAEAHTPDAAAGTHDPPAHAGAETPAGRKTATGKPTPTASATASHEPDPPPQTRPDRTGETAGRQAAGHGPEGNATSAEPGPPAAANATTARVRAANAHRAGDPARTTRAGEPAAAAAAATAASTPDASPTTTERPERRTERTAGTTSGETDEREPANATTADTTTTPAGPRRQRNDHNRENTPRQSFSPRGGTRKARAETAQRRRRRSRP